MTDEESRQQYQFLIKRGKMEIPQNPLFTFLYWLLNTPGVGALFVAFLGLVLILLFSAVLRWIAKGSAASESIVYTYPTEGLHSS
jgi:hypothetical protein